MRKKSSEILKSVNSIHVSFLVKEKTLQPIPGLFLSSFLPFTFLLNNWKMLHLVSCNSHRYLAKFIPKQKLSDVFCAKTTREINPAGAG